MTKPFTPKGPAHLTGHPTFTHMYSTHLDVWRKLMRAACEATQDEKARERFSQELVTIDFLEQLAATPSALPSRHQIASAVREIEAHTPFWRQQLEQKVARCAARCDFDNSSYYEHEIKALDDIVAAAAVERQRITQPSNEGLSPS